MNTHQHPSRPLPAAPLLAAETTKVSALTRGVVHGVCLSAAIWAVIGWAMALLR